MKPGRYTSFIGGDVVLKSNGRLSIFNDRNVLAGSAQSLLEAINFLVSHEIRDLKEAWDLASERPYQYFYDTNCELLSKGLAANFCIVEIIDSDIQVNEVYINGTRVA